MYNNPLRKKILGAFLVGIACVLIALVLRPASKTTGLAGSTNDIVVVPAPDRQAIPITDTNQDGVPDWQEVLKGNDEIILTASSSDYQPPQTLTDQFALEFFEQMVRSGNSGAFGATPEELVDVSSDALLAQAIDEPITRADINISSNTSVSSLEKYGEAIATIITTYEENSGRNEAQILQEALRLESEEALSALDPKITAYQDFYDATINLSVPENLVPYHLSLLTIYKAQVNTITAMRNVYTDPMLALVRLKRYQEDVDTLHSTITSLYNKILSEGGRWPNNANVYKLIEIS